MIKSASILKHYEIQKIILPNRLWKVIILSTMWKTTHNTCCRCAFITSYCYNPKCFISKSCEISYTPWGTEQHGLGILTASSYYILNKSYFYHVFVPTTTRGTWDKYWYSILFYTILYTILHEYYNTILYNTITLWANTVRVKILTQYHLIVK